MTKCSKMAGYALMLTIMNLNVKVNNNNLHFTVKNYALHLNNEIQLFIISHFHT